MFGRSFRINSGLKSAATFGAALSLATSVFATCEFDKKGFPSQLAAPDNAGKPLVLSGVGMRRKNLYVMEVDVYQVGFYVENDIALPGE